MRIIEAHPARAHRACGESPSPDRFAKSEAVDLSHKGRGDGIRGSLIIR
jgi:hypothetical protein